MVQLFFEKRDMAGKYMVRINGLWITIYDSFWLFYETLFPAFYEIHKSIFQSPTKFDFVIKYYFTKWVAQQKQFISSLQCLFTWHFKVECFIVKLLYI